MSSRRHVVLSVLATLGAIPLLPARSAPFSPDDTRQMPEHDRLLAALGLRAIDLSALLEHAPTRGQLAELLQQNRPRWEQLRAVGPDHEVRATLCRWIAEDFTTGALAEVDGWQLARSEAMVLAVLAAARV